MGFDLTLEKFNDECSSKGKVIANKDRNNKPNQKVNVIMVSLSRKLSPPKKSLKSTISNSQFKNEMVQLFCHGQRKEFFRRWLQNIPANIVNNDTSAQKLEFELNIHFAIYPLKTGAKDVILLRLFIREIKTSLKNLAFKLKNQAEESMNAFKNFIETRGRSLSQTTEFLPYFALPYVPNPQDNQGYQEIFSVRKLSPLKNKTFFRFFV
jgi:hypothetical protein